MKAVTSQNGVEVEERLLPAMEVGDNVKQKELNLNQHFTQPPPRYTEAMLVKTLEEKGIGRPSTYAPIIDTIAMRGYVYTEDKRFRPTELGIIVVDLLKEHFSNLLDVDFTAGMEQKLDLIEEGEVVWQDVIREFYEPFVEDLERAHKTLEKIDVQG